MKKILLNCLCVALMAICNVGNVFAEDIPNNEIWYTSTDGYVVTPYASNVFGANIVSNTYESGKGVIKFDGDVTSIGVRAFDGCSSLASITIPNSVTSIERSTFYDCSNLTSITIPNFVTSIGYMAFSNCSSLTSINIPNSVTSIGYYAFHGCSSLPIENNIRYADTYMVGAVDKTLSSYSIKGGTRWVGDEAFLSCSNLVAIVIPNSVIEIGCAVFCNCSSLKYASLSNTLVTIGDQAFSNCSNLASISIPNSVTSIGWYAFSNCSSLASITIPNSVTSIGYQTFYNCSNLASITIPNSVTSIGSSAFYDCTKLTAVYIDDIESWCKIKFENYCANPTYYAHKLYIDNVEVTEVVIPSTIKTINDYAFDGCSSLASVTIPNSVTSIGEHAFYNCSNLTSITIPNSVTSIGSGAFYSCSSLTSITIPNSVTSIGDWTFYDCSSLASITIPNSVTSIGMNAFYDCSSLTSITIPNSVTSIEGGAFYNCSNLSSVTNLATIPQSIYAESFSNYSTLHVYEGLKSLYEADAVWGKFTVVDDVPTVKATSITLGSSTYYCNVGGILQPSATVSDEATIKAVTWTSSDLSVLAIIDANTGQAFGLQEGVATITATTTDGSALSASATVYVGDYTPVTSVTLDKSTAELMVDESLTLSATVLPDDATKKTVAWTSSNPEVATVSSEGVVSALSVGTTTITATSTDGTALSATCAVTVVTANVSVTDTENVTTHTYVKSGDDMALSDNIKSIVITESIAGVDVTYTRSFTAETAGNWQAWYMPFDVAYDDMSTHYEVAEVYGILMDKAGSIYVAFNKMTEGTVKAHTPYVVKANAAGDVVVTTTTDLQPTEDAKSFAIQSAYNNFTFGGVYENSYLSTSSSTAYALNKNGDFAAMASDVYLRPFRIYMRITDREDNPYAAATTSSKEVKVVVIGEDDTTGLESLTPNPSPEGEGSIYNLSGQRINKMQRGINIVNGKKVLY